MDGLLNWLWQGALVAIVAAATLRLLDRARASVRCVVCWAALIVIAFLPLAPFVLPIKASAVQATVAPTPIVTVPDAWWTSSAVIYAALAIWMGLYASRIIAAAVIVRRARARCRPFPAAVERTLASWQRIRNTGRPVRLVLSDRIRAAAVLGCGRPVIAVAPTLIARLEAEELDRIVVHEWGHVQRRDDLTNIGQLLVRAVAGWHPAAWWLDRRLSIEQELACDEIVVAVSGGAKSYASCLVKLASLRIAERDVLLASGALSSAGLARRVARLVTGRTFAGPLWSRSTAALVVMLLVTLALGIAPVRIVEAATVARVIQPTVESAAMRSIIAIPMYSAPDAGSERSRRPSAARIATPEAPVSFIGAAHTIDLPAAPKTERPTAPVSEPMTHPADTDGESLRQHDPVPPPLDAAAASVLTSSPPPLDNESRFAWSPAADAGVAVARGSKKAGVATAGAFTRFAKKIAGSF